MGVSEAEQHLRQHWEKIEAKLRAGTYQPAAVRAVEIPKPQGGVRTLGIPTVIDRVIQQAMAQVLTEIWEPHFSAHSYGFRPGRSAHQAVAKAQQYLGDGYGWVVDLDLEKFFDKVKESTEKRDAYDGVGELFGGLARELARALGHLGSDVADDHQQCVASDGRAQILLRRVDLDQLFLGEAHAQMHEHQCTRGDEPNAVVVVMHE